MECNKLVEFERFCLLAMIRTPDCRDINELQNIAHAKLLASMGFIIEALITIGESIQIICSLMNYEPKTAMGKGIDYFWQNEAAILVNWQKPVYWRQILSQIID